MKVENRTFIVSGGSSGLGLSVVLDLLTADAYVAVIDRQSLPAAVPPNVRCLQLRTDIRNVDEIEASVKRAAEWTRETGAELGGVIACAGLGRVEPLINSKGKAHEKELWDTTMDVNVSGTFHLTRLALEHLILVKPEDTPDGERGVIIHIASEAAFEGQPGQSAYAASKGAVRSMTLPMARDLARYHVRVVSIAPGPFSTPLVGTLPPKVLGSMRTGAMLYPKRFGKPEEFAKTVRWILECAYVNGETIRLTGGARLPAFL